MLLISFSILSNLTKVLDTIIIVIYYILLAKPNRALVVSDSGLNYLATGCFPLAYA